jgi:transketolase
MNDKAHNLKIYKIIREHGGWDNWTMVLIETFPCKDKNEACKREREVYEELDAKMNMLRPYRTQEEDKQKRKQYHKKYDKQYKEDHKEKYKKYDKQYHEDHKAERKQYGKKYREDHKAELNKKIQCEYCSKLLSKRNMTRHHDTCKSKSNSICL